MFGNREIDLPDEQNLKFMNDEKRLELEADVKKIVRKINEQREDLPNMNYGMILGGFKWRIDELEAKVQKYEAYCYKLHTKLLAEAEKARMNELMKEVTVFLRPRASGRHVTA